MELNAPYSPPSKLEPSEFKAEYAPPAGFVDYWDWTKLKDNQSGVRTGRLAMWLRSAAATRNPLEILGRAVVARFMPPYTGNVEAESNALADLAVTGRAAYAAFCANRIDDAALIKYVQPKLPGKSQQQLQDAVRKVLDHAYTVAWALRGSPSQRSELRPKLGWIAISGEDDPPHVPVNLPCCDAYMGELEVADGSSRLTLRATLRLPDNPVPEPLPGNYLRQIPKATAFTDALNNREAAGYDALFLFVHGLASRCEEAETFKKLLIARGVVLGRRYAVLSVDMPGMGYSPRLDIDSLISRRTHGGFHGFKLPNGADSHFPLLGLYRDTLVQICNNVPGGVQYVMGGSLGGNMTLWLAADPMFTELAPANNKPSSIISFLAWSPASIWESYERSRDTPFEGNGTHLDVFKNTMKKKSYARMQERETENTRWHFFEIPQRGEEVLGVHINGGWGYPPNKENILIQSELYSEQYRRTFWAAGYEQVVFSHQEPLAPLGGVPFKTWPFKTIRKPLFLASGAKDNGSGLPGMGRLADIYDPVIAVTEACPEVQGQRLLLLETGHSIHDEQPDLLAEKINAFLKTVGYTFGQAQDQIKRYQTFTCSEDKLLAGIDIMIRKNSGSQHSDLVVRLYETNSRAPLGAALASAVIPAASVGANWTAVNAPVYYPKLIKGHEYAVVLSQKTPGTANYEWAVGMAGNTAATNNPGTAFGKWNGSSWVNESGLGDGWLKLWTLPAYLVTPVEIVHTGTRGNGFGNSSDEIKRYQTFTLAAGATVLGVDLKLRKYDGTAQSDVRVELFAVSNAGGKRPTGAAIAACSIPALHIGTDWAVVHTALKSPCLAAGTYAVVLSQKNLGKARYEWAVGAPANAASPNNAAAFGKWNGSNWIDESNLGDGWTRVWSFRPEEEVAVTHNVVTGNGFGNRSDEIRRYQTFSVPQSAQSIYQMMAVQLKVRKIGGSDQSDLLVQLYDTEGSKPMGFALTKAVIPASSIGTDWTVVTIPLHYYTTSRKYAVVLSQRNPRTARYEWAAGKVSDSQSFGKWDGSAWVDESVIGDGWLKVSLVASAAPN